MKKNTRLSDSERNAKDLHDINRTLRKFHEVIYFDIDLDLLDEQYIEWLIKEYGGFAELYSTKNGYHIKFYPENLMMGTDVLMAMLRMNCDGLHIRRWLTTGKQALFYVRRGSFNEVLRKVFI